MTPTPSRDEILACPFCGNAPHVENAAPIGGAAMIYCRSDECLGPSTTAATLQDAMVQWNTRLAVSASDGVQPSIPDCQQCNEQSGKELSRAAEMLHIASTMILAHCPEETYFYDGTDCDGICIADDCLSARESLLELADTHRTESAESTPPAVFSDPTSQPPESGER